MTEDQVTRALRLAQIGAHVFPVAVAAKAGGGFDKRPLVQWTAGATTDAEQIVTWWERWPTASIGVHCGRSMLIVTDGDRGHSGDSLDAMLAAGLPDTWRHTSSSGEGEHFVYAAPEGDWIGSTRLGFEVKGTRHLFVWPDAAPIPAGRDAFAPAPDAILWPREFEAEASPQLLETWLAARPGAPVGQLFERVQAIPVIDQWTNADLTGVARGIVLAAEDFEGGAGAYAAYVAAWASGPYADAEHRAEAERAFVSALAYAEARGEVDPASPPLTLEAMFSGAGAQVVAQAEAITRAAASAPLRLDALMAREFAELDWVVPGVIPEGTTLLVAPPKAGKSWLALDVALAAATGGKAFGGIAVGEPRPVLYVDLESGERRLQSRVRAQGWREFGRFEYLLDRDAADSAIEAFMSKHRGERPLVVIDTLIGVMGDKPKERTQYKHEYETLSRFQRLTRADPGSAFLIAHHTRKMVGSDALDAVSGTNGTAGAIDTPIILARPERHDAKGTLNVMARDFEGGEFALTFEGCKWILEGGDVESAQRMHEARAVDAERGKLAPVGQGVLQVIESDSARVWSVQDVVTAYGGAATQDTIRQNLRRLADRGLVAKIGYGVYGMVDPIPA